MDIHNSPYCQTVVTGTPALNLDQVPELSPSLQTVTEGTPSSELAPSLHSRQGEPSQTPPIEERSAEQVTNSTSAPKEAKQEIVEDDFDAKRDVKAEIEAQIAAEASEDSAAPLSLASRPWSKADQDGRLDTKGIKPTPLPEPGIKAKTVWFRKTPLYPTPPDSKLRSGAKVPPAKILNREQPIIVHDVVDKDDKIRPDIVYVEAYTRKNKPGQRRTVLPQKEGEVIKPELTGFMRRGDVEQNIRTTSFRAASGTLFLQAPSEEDVVQGSIGDCFLMAALASLAKTNPDALLGAIKDNKDGTVTVRLYKKNAEGQHVPCYYQIKKSVPEQNLRSSQQSARGEALWVKLFEKALALHIVQQPESKSEAVSRSYVQLNKGGSSSAVLEAITGRSAQRLEIINRAAEDLAFFLLGQLIKTNEAHAHEFDQLLQKNPRLVQEIPSLSLAQFRSKMQQLGLSPALIECLMKYLEGVEKLEGVDTGELPAGKRGSGSYTNHQQESFRQVKNALAQGKAITIGSIPTPPPDAKIEGRGRSAGEAINQGIAFKHCYSVVGTEERDGIKYLKLRNPWGDAPATKFLPQSSASMPGRRYDDRFNPSPSPKATFNLELSDLNLFDGITISG